MWVENLWPGAESLGGTHLAHACCRVHPAEWGIDEVAGTMEAVLLERGCGAQELLRAGAPRNTLFTRLNGYGVPRYWPEELLRRRAEVGPKA